MVQYYRVTMRQVFVDNNILNPNSNGASWVPHFFYGLTAITMGGANITMTLAQYSKAIIVISGVLTADLELIFPDIVGQWIVANTTTGPHSITLKTLAGAGVVLAQSFNMMVFCDSAGIFDATSNALTVTIANTLYALIHGDTANAFNVANASTSQNAIPLGQADGRYAAIAGDPGNNFDVAAAVLATQAVNLGQFTGVSSLASPGYIKFPGGLILQWGFTAILASGGTEVTAFPIPFPNLCFAVVMTHENFSGPSTAATFTVTAVATNSFTCAQQSGSSAQAFWFAAGN